MCPHLRSVLKYIKSEPFGFGIPIRYFGPNLRVVRRPITVTVALTPALIFLTHSSPCAPDPYAVDAQRVDDPKSLDARRRRWGCEP
jgi:hypothetical protein